MEELDLKELIQIFWEKRVQIILITAIFIVVGVIYTVGFVKPKYQSITSLLLATNSSNQTNTNGITTNDLTINSKLVSTYTDMLNGDNAIRTIISNLGMELQEDEVRNSISVKARDNADMIDIIVKNDDPVVAQKIANESAKVLIEKVKQYYKIDNLYIYDEAEVENAPYNINHKKDILIFAVIGIVLAFGYVLVANMLDTTIKSVQDIEKIPGATVLASIPVYDLTESKGRRGGKR
mgnify:FL=1